MAEFGDRFFQHHVAVAGILGLLALHHINDSILPFNCLPHADELQVYKSILSNLLGQRISLDLLTTSIQEFAFAAKEVNNESKKLTLQETAGCFVDMKRRELNDRLMLAEKVFLDADGLKVFGPPKDHESKINVFLGIPNSMTRSTVMSEKQRLATIQHEVWRVASAIQRAASARRGDST